MKFCKGFQSLKKGYEVKRWTNVILILENLKFYWKNIQPKETSEPKLADETSEAWVVPESVAVLGIEFSKGYSSKSPVRIDDFSWRWRMKTWT